MVKTNKLPGREATRTLFRWARKVVDRVDKMYNFDYVLKSDRELRETVRVSRVYDVVPSFSREREESVFSSKSFEKETVNMPNNSVFAVVRNNLAIEVVIQKKDVGHEKITITAGGTCKAARKKKSFFSESSEMEVIVFENI